MAVHKRSGQVRVRSGSDRLRNRPVRSESESGIGARSGIHREVKHSIFVWHAVVELGGGARAFGGKGVGEMGRGMREWEWTGVRKGSAGRCTGKRPLIASLFDEYVIQYMLVTKLLVPIIQSTINQSEPTTINCLHTVPRISHSNILHFVTLYTTVLDKSVQRLEPSSRFLAISPK